MKEVYRCGAGRGKMAVGTGGEVWGCFLFHDYFKNRRVDPRYKDFSFGNLDDFIAGFPRRYFQVLANYSDLRQEYFHAGGKPCFLCSEVESCMVCPVYAAYSGGGLGKISCTQCSLTKIEREARNEFNKFKE